MGLCGITDLKGGILVDVGANVGSISLLVADHINRAILFEPNPVAAARARENTAITIYRSRFMNLQFPTFGAP
jgi:FkbM family methyltransferase